MQKPFLTLTMCSTVFSASLGSASIARADIPEGDVYLTVANNVLHTGLIAEDESSTTPNIRVFYGVLGEDAPNVGADPGFFGIAGTFSPGTSVGFDLTRALRVWNGSDFSMIPASTMTLSFGAGSITSPTTDVYTPGFTVPVDADGEFHHHPTFTLNAPTSDGIYLLTVSLTATGLAPAPPISMLWNQNIADEAVAQAAYDFASATVPAPAAAALLGSVAIFAVPRRRRLTH